MTQRYIPKPVIPANGDTVFRYPTHRSDSLISPSFFVFPPSPQTAEIVCANGGRPLFQKSDHSFVELFRVTFFFSSFLFLERHLLRGIFVEKRIKLSQDRDISVSVSNDFPIRLQRLSDIIDVVVLYWFLSFIH